MDKSLWNRTISWHDGMSTSVKKICFKMGGTVINNISYADDIVSIVESENRLEQLMDTVVEGSDANGLFMNSAKSFTMVFLKFHGISTCKITIDCYRLDHANRFL